MYILESWHDNWAIVYEEPIVCLYQEITPDLSN